MLLDVSAAHVSQRGIDTLLILADLLQQLLQAFASIAIPDRSIDHMKDSIRVLSHVHDFDAPKSTNFVAPASNLHQSIKLLLQI